MIGWKKKRWSPFWTTPPTRDLDETYLAGNEYLDAFKEKPKKKGGPKVGDSATSDADLKRLERALAQAHDARKFEIDMYWKRATYFWTFIGAAFVGYAAFFNAASRHAFGALLMSQVGLVFTMAWYLANRGSKFWQENWENQVNLLEDAITGPLYKMTAERPDYLEFVEAKASADASGADNTDSGDEDDARRQRYAAEGKEAEKWDEQWTGPRPYSVSKINAVVSLYVMVIWLLLAAAAIAALWAREMHHWLSNFWVLNYIRIAACVALIAPTVVVYRRFARYVGTYPGDHSPLVSRRTVEPHVPARPISGRKSSSS